jgi:hypothetical protein
VADRASGDIAEVAVGTNRRKDGSNNIAAVLARLANRLMDFAHLDAPSMSVFFQHPFYLVGVLGREFKIRTLLCVAVRPVQGVVRVNLHG